MTAESSAGSAPTLFEQILAVGYGIARLDAAESDRLAELYSQSTEFFAAPTSVKERCGVPNRASGYRPHGYAHAGSPDQPDLNDSFLYWKRRRETLPHHEEIGPFLDAAESHRTTVARIATEVIDGMRAFYSYQHDLTFEDASFLQINSFAEPTDRELLQLPHEDAILLTVISTSAPGLESVLGATAKPVTLAPNEVLVMPGSVMTVMTGGKIEPFYHQVRNHNLLGRRSIMYFVSPDTTRLIEPYVRNESNADVDIRALVISNPQTFGLSEDFVTA